MKRPMVRARLVLLAAALAATVATAPVLLAGQGNQIPPGVNPFAHLLGLIAALQAEVDALQGGTACGDVADVIVGTWSVANAGHGTAGQVTFAADGSYTIDSGTYNAGGTFMSATGGAYQVVAGRAIAFTYAGWSGTTPVSRIAVVECATASEIVHFLMGHTHDFEILTRLP